MCGIVGFTGSPDKALLELMNSLIYHRGPDDEGFYLDGNVNLAMRRLSIIDLNTGSQPIANEGKTVWVVFNGEIYNYKEIRRELQSKGHAFATNCDTEVIAHGYEQWGEGFVSRLNGMFAIAVWDITQRKLILYRDRIGIKPLFYTITNGRLLFASEIKSLLANPDFKKDIDFESLHHYFSCKHVPAPKTIFKGIFSLNPGEKLVYQNSTIKKSLYWQLRYEEDETLTEQEAASQILKTLDEAVTSHMVADVPVGAYLSGGIDSSSVVALMSRHAKGRIKTFCLGYEDDFKNKAADIKFARQVSDIFGTQHYEYIMRAKEIPNDMHEIISCFSEPFSGVVSTYYLSKLIREHVKVALSGDGADEMFGSYLAHRLAYPIHNYINMNMDGRELSQSDINALGSFKNNIDYIRKIASPETYIWRSKLSVFSEDEKQQLYSGIMKSYTQPYSTVALYKSYFDTATTKCPLNKILENEMKALLPDQVLAFVDRLSMAHSIEVRPPYLDHRMVELSAKIHGSMKIKGESVKNILKLALTDILPQELLNRPKEGFVLPVNQWILSNLGNFIMDTLSEDNLKKHNFFNINAVNALLKSHFNLQVDNSAKLWNLVCFQVWFEKYFD